MGHIYKGLLITTSCVSSYTHIHMHLIEYIVEVRLLLQHWNIILKTQLYIYIYIR